MPERPALIRLAGRVLEVAGESPSGSLILINRTGLLRRREQELEAELAAVRAELAALDAEASGFDGKGQM
jgi:hypothetical protein